MTDDRVQHYRLLHRLGAGGMGEVYLAEDPRLGRQLALKLLPAEFAQDASRRARFLTEARAAAALNHPNICTVYDAGETVEGRLFIALELLEGETLDVRLKRGPLEVREVVGIGVQLSGALEAAHAKGILHRDLKPSNLHLDARAHLKVLDFGLAKRLVPDSGLAEDSTQWQTRTGGILGTPQYMSPEQAMGKALDARSDLFSCGAVLYELLTGRGPFSGPTFAELVEQLVHRPPEAIARFNYAVPAELERVVLKCLQKVPDQRYQSARELAVDLRGVEAHLRGEAVSGQLGPAQVVTWVLVGTNAEDLERTLGVQETARILNDFQEAMGRGLRKFSQARKEASLGSTVLLSFARPSDAVKWALGMVAATQGPLQCRTGLHLGEVAAVTPGAGERYGEHLTVCERLLQLARPGQVLMGRAVFDSARQVWPMGSVDGAAGLSWVSHGPYLLQGIEGPLEVCEVGTIGRSPLSAPSTSERARRQVGPEEEPVLGWRPAVGQAVPSTPWVLEEKLGEGGFGEVWVAQHPKLRERRVFKFCFRADRVRALKRELTLFRLLKEHVGEHPNIVRLHDVYLDEPPFYLEEEYVEGKDLKSWCEAQGGVENVPLETRLEIVAQAAEALQAAHDAGIIHRDVKPGNILVRNRRSGIRGRKTEDGPRDTDDGSRIPNDGVRNVDPTPPAAADSPAPISHLPSPGPLTVKLTDFGIGQVISAEYLKGVTQAGFTHTMLVDSSSSKTGTQLYMAPELLAGKPASTRSDIYSLGVVLHQLLIEDFGRPVTTDWAQDVEDPLMREDLQRCFAGKPEDRFTGAGQLAKNLRALPQRRAERERREAQVLEAQRLRQKAERRRRLLLAATTAGLALLAIAIALGFGLHRAERASSEARQNLYAAEMMVAGIALDEQNRGHARTVLHRYLPPSREAGLRGWEWRHFWEACRSDEHATIGEHEGPVVVALFSPDGRSVASAGYDRTVRVWDLESRSRRTTLHHQSRVYGLAFSPDGLELASASWDGTVRIWDVATGSVRSQWTNDYPIYTVAYSPRGDSLALAGARGVLRLSLPDLVEQDRRHCGNVLAFPQGLAYSSDGALLAYRQDLRRVIVKDLARATEIRLETEGHSAQVLSFSPDSRHLASFVGTPRPGVLVWDLATQRPVVTLTNHGAPLTSVAFSPGGDLLAATGNDQTIHLYDTSTWQVKASLVGHEDGVWSVGFSPDGSLLVSGGKDGTVRLWYPRATARETRFVNKPIGSSLALSADGTCYGVLDGSGVYRLHPTESLRQDQASALPATSPSALAIGPGGARLALCSDQGLMLLLRDPPETDWRTLPADPERVGLLTFSSDGRLLAGWSAEVGVLIYEVEPPRRIATLPVSARPWRLRFSNSGTLLGVPMQNDQAEVWSIAEQRPLATLRGHRDQVTDLRFSTAEDIAYTCSLDATVRRWDWRREQSLMVLRGALMRFECLALSSDGRRVAAAGFDGTVRLWDTTTMQQTAVLKGTRGRVSDLAFLPGTDTLAAVDGQGLEYRRAPSLSEIDRAEAGSLHPR